MYTYNMYTLYKSDDLKEILVQLIKKARNTNYTINVLCKNEETTTELSQFLWGQCIPHWILNDKYDDQNNIFLTTEIHKADILIIYYDAPFNKSDTLNFTKKIILGNHHNLDGEYWGKTQKGWTQLTKEVFYS